MVFDLSRFENAKGIESLLGQYRNGPHLRIGSLRQCKRTGRHHDLKVLRDQIVPLGILVAVNHGLDHAAPETVLRFAQMGCPCGHEHVRLAGLIGALDKEDIGLRFFQVCIQRLIWHQVQIALESAHIFENKIANGIDSLNLLLEMRPDLPEFGMLFSNLVIQVRIGPKALDPVGMLLEPRVLARFPVCGNFLGFPSLVNNLGHAI